MTFRGVNFRLTLAGASGFAGDGPNDVWCGATSSSYKSVADGGTGYGWVAAVGSMSNYTTTDPRLAGAAFLNGSPRFRYDCPNGNYKFRLAIGGGGAAGIRKCRVRVGAGTTLGTDYFDIASLASVSSVQVADAVGNVWGVADFDANNVTIDVTVTQGYVLIDGGLSGGSQIRHFAIEQADSALADLELTDDTGVAGTTPSLFEAQPAEKLVAKLSQTIGGPSNTSIEIFEADGVTPSEYLEIATVNNEQWIVHKNVRFPGTNPTYTVVLKQTDTSGETLYSNSPYSQTVTMNVTAAPDKPWGGDTLMDKITTGCWLARENIVNKFLRPYTGDIATSGEWPGYTGQTINASTTVYTVQALRDTIDAYQVQARIATNTTYCVEIDEDETSDWDIHEMAHLYPVWDFFPENGNMLLVRYKEDGAKPILRGGWMVAMMRGVHVYGLTWGMDKTAVPYLGGSSSAVANGIRFYPNPNSTDTSNTGGVSQHGRLQILKIEKCRVGLKFCPGYEDVTVESVDASGTGPLMGAFATGTNTIVGEQFILKDSVIWGVDAALTPFGHYLLHIENVDAAMSSADLLGTYSISPIFKEWIPGADQEATDGTGIEQFEWIDGLHLRAVVNNGDNPVHADYHQQRTNSGPPAFDTAGITYRIFENCCINESFDAAGIARENWINSSTGPQATVHLNNLAVSYAARGIETGYGQTCYCEYNTLGIPYKMPLGVNNVAMQGIYPVAGGGQMKTYKNIYSAGNSVSTQFPNEKNVVYATGPGRPWAPDTIFQGPFEDDPTQTGRWRAQAWDDDPQNGVTLDQFLERIKSVHKQAEGVDAGAFLYAYTEEEEEPPVEVPFKGFNFRGTLAGPTGFAGDGPDDIWAGVTPSSYKSVDAGGTGYGWIATNGYSSNDTVGSSYDPRLAGSSLLNFSPQYRIDLPNGEYDIRLALDAYGSGSTRYAYMRLRVGSGNVSGTDYYDILSSYPGTMDATQVMDAMGNVMAKADWAENNQTRRVTVTQGCIMLQAGLRPDGVNLVAGTPKHFAYRPVSTQLADGVITDDTHISGTTPKLYEAQPDQKVVAWADFSVGGPADVDYSVTLSDGVTPDPYLTTRIIGGKVAICHNGTRHPGSPASRTIYLVQTNKVAGTYANSPKKQAITMQVVGAPTKPHGDGSLLAKSSTQAFLKRKQIVDQLSAPYQSDRSGGLWKGYQGQEFVQQTTVYNTAGFKTTMAAMVAQAGAGKWFCIEIDEDETSDWATANIQQNNVAAGDWLFYPELGGGLVIRYRAEGAKPQINGYVYMRCPRGVHVDGLTMANASSHMFRMDGGISAGNDLSLLKFSNMKMGARFLAANADTTVNDMTPVAAADAFFINGACEQFICVDSHVSGVYDAYSIRARYTYIENCDTTYLNSDVHGMAPLVVDDRAKYPGGDYTQYIWIKGNRVRAHLNQATNAHSDFYQQRTANIDAPVNLLMEDNMVMFSGTLDNSGASGQATILSDSLVSVTPVYLNNIFCTTAAYGLQICQGAGVVGYAEYNSFGIPTTMGPGSNQYVQQKLWAGTNGAVFKGRKNILFATDAVSEDDIFYDSRVSVGKPPSACFAGTFVIDDSTNPALPRYLPSGISEDPFQGVTAQDFMKAMTDNFKPADGVDAGFQELWLKAVPGDTPTILTREQAAKLRITGFAVGSYPNAVKLRWAKNGDVEGVDISLEFE